MKCCFCLEIDHILMFFIILLSPLFNFLSLLLFGRYIGRKGSIVCSIFFCTLSLLLTLFAFFSNLSTGFVLYIPLFSWIKSSTFDLNFTLLFDSLSLIMFVLVLTVSTIVHIYSIEYMHNDPHIQRFISYLSLFTFFMLILVSASNFIQLFIGWEGVGLCSYLLISFWYTRLQANKAAMKAIFFNRIGDCGLIISIMTLFYFAHSFDFNVIFNIVSYLQHEQLDFGVFTVSALNFVAFFMLLAAIGKSAQFFLHVWLADAMEGPTPVSALIHAATMVTAGIFLLVRCSYILQYSEGYSFMTYIISILTILFASTAGVFQNDIKKIIAYSTCSQLGYMLMACAFYNYNEALFHLFNHGFFKALLFLSAGLIIHNMNDEQDLRKLGGLLHIMPLTYTFFFIGTCSLVGFPFLAGYYSKDFILENLYIYSDINHFLAYHICCFSVFLTSFYSFRLLFLSFYVQPNGFKVSYKSYLSGLGLEAWNSTIILLTLLALLSVIAGYVFKDSFIGFGSNFLLFSIYQHSLNLNNVYYLEYLFDMKYLPLFYILLGIVSSFSLVFFNKQLSNYMIHIPFFYKSYVFFNQAWLINHLYYLIYNGFKQLAYWSFFFDKYFLELIGPLFAHRNLFLSSRFVNHFSNVVLIDNLLIVAFFIVLLSFFSNIYL